MSQHRKLTLEKKLLPPLLPGLEPDTFRSRVHRFTTELFPLPHGSLKIQTVDHLDELQHGLEIAGTNTA